MLMTKTTALDKSHETKLARTLARAEFHKHLTTAVSILNGTHVTVTRTTSDKSGTTVTEQHPTARDKLQALTVLERIARLRPEDDEPEGAGIGGRGIDSTALVRAFVAALADPVNRRWLQDQPNMLRQVQLLAAEPVDNLNDPENNPGPNGASDVGTST